MAKTVADQFAETLAAAGVKRIYGIVGDSLNGLTDAIRRPGKIEWVHVRHEERGIRLEDPADVERGIVAALTHDGPALADAVASPTVLPIPPTITVEMAKGFTLYMVKTVFNGRGDDFINLARSNQWA
jgi:thiamine pyrophosphate-dependent acetolactate synthase large subunit-like protein